jgi:hypothetical protein
MIKERVSIVLLLTMLWWKIWKSQSHGSEGGPLLPLLRKRLLRRRRRKQKAMRILRTPSTKKERQRKHAEEGGSQGRRTPKPHTRTTAHDFPRRCQVTLRQEAPRAENVRRCRILWTIPSCPLTPCPWMTNIPAFSFRNLSTGTLSRASPAKHTATTAHSPTPSTSLLSLPLTLTLPRLPITSLLTILTSIHSPPTLNTPSRSQPQQHRWVHYFFHLLFSFVLLMSNSFFLGRSSSKYRLNARLIDAPHVQFVVPIEANAKVSQLRHEIARRYRSFLSAEVSSKVNW